MKRVIAAFLISPLFAGVGFIIFYIIIPIIFSPDNFYDTINEFTKVVHILYLSALLPALFLVAFIVFPIFLCMTKRPFLSILPIDKLYSYVFLGIFLGFAPTSTFIGARYAQKDFIGLVTEGFLFPSLTGIICAMVFYRIGIHKNPYIQKFVKKGAA